MTAHTARRAFLTGALAAPVAATVPAISLVTIDPVTDATDKLVAAMAKRHGGQWQVHVDHEAGLVMVRQISTEGGAA